MSKGGQLTSSSISAIFGSKVSPTLIHPTLKNVILHSKFFGKGFAYFKGIGIGSILSGLHLNKCFVFLFELRIFNKRCLASLCTFLYAKRKNVKWSDLC